ncbi:hypothetical protein CC1G_11633 [Coprinopsis cinerea okayama7|uniref:HMG box domain-containing protein n=1 Tax=Coprinopsis cinerea (strain Okayama-7 / 130 / ATCC MYA-4618 / FGSC 9003) TaxID=240176 RepID=A8P468_COPC7|nr:hypothetical protein CC1G_11633 [Coprinopsis cinerea okayama7\|eukprot:XP_001838690.2 hypothetical protein CC1G_11633 [Coprinopsis cinerea okayama7\
MANPSGSKGSKQSDTTISRPPNAWILFRTHFSQQCRANGVKDAVVISRQASQAWASLPEKDKDQWRKLAHILKAQYDQERLQNASQPSQSKKRKNSTDEGNVSGSEVETGKSSNVLRKGKQTLKGVAKAITQKLSIAKDRDLKGKGRAQDAAAGPSSEVISSTESQPNEPNFLIWMPTFVLDDSPDTDDKNIAANPHATDDSLTTRGKDPIGALTRDEPQVNEGDSVTAPEPHVESVGDAQTRGSNEPMVPAAKPVTQSNVPRTIPSTGSSGIPQTEATSSQLAASTSSQKSSGNGSALDVYGSSREASETNGLTASTTAPASTQQWTNCGATSDGPHYSSDHFALQPKPIVTHSFASSDELTRSHRRQKLTHQFHNSVDGYSGQLYNGYGAVAPAPGPSRREEPIASTPKLVQSLALVNNLAYDRYNYLIPAVAPPQARVPSNSRPLVGLGPYPQFSTQLAQCNAVTGAEERAIETVPARPAAPFRPSDEPLPSTSTSVVPFVPTNDPTYTSVSKFAQPQARVASSNQLLARFIANQRFAQLPLYTATTRGTDGIRQTESVPPFVPERPKEPLPSTSKSIETRVSDSLLDNDGRNSYATQQFNPLFGAQYDMATYAIPQSSVPQVAHAQVAQPAHSQSMEPSTSSTATGPVSIPTQAATIGGAESQSIDASNDYNSTLDYPLYPQQNAQYTSSELEGNGVDGVNAYTTYQDEFTQNYDSGLAFTTPSTRVQQPATNTNDFGEFVENAFNINFTDTSTTYQDFTTWASDVASVATTPSFYQPSPATDYDSGFTDDDASSTYQVQLPQELTSESSVSSVAAPTPESLQHPSPPTTEYSYDFGFTADEQEYIAVYSNHPAEYPDSNFAQSTSQADTNGCTDQQATYYYLSGWGVEGSN